MGFFLTRVPGGFMSDEKIKEFRQWLSTLPEQDLTLENAVKRIFIALDYLTNTNANNQFKN